MRIAGLQKFSLIDFDDKICAIVFTQGCNLFCPYCHNPRQVPMLTDIPLIAKAEVEKFLKSRIGKLDGVVITGGEPLLQPDLIPFLETVKDMGFLIKLDTNGVRPDLLKRVIETNLIDYIAMDLKCSLDNYFKVVKVEIKKEQILASIDCIVDSKLDHEFRTTVVEGLIDEEDILNIAKHIPKNSKYFLQNFQKSEHLNSDFAEKVGYSKVKLDRILAKLEDLGINAKIRN